MKVVAQWLSRLTPPCRSVTQLVSAGMDHTLPLRARLRLHLHLLLCKWCRAYNDQLRTVRQTLRSRPDLVMTQDPTSLQPSPKIKERLARAYRGN